MEIITYSESQSRNIFKTYNFATEEEKMKILALFELLEHLSFPFLSAMNIKSEINNTICVEY